MERSNKLGNHPPMCKTSAPNYIFLNLNQQSGTSSICIIWICPLHFLYLTKTSYFIVPSALMSWTFQIISYKERLHPERSIRTTHARQNMKILNHNQCSSNHDHVHLLLLFPTAGHHNATQLNCSAALCSDSWGSVLTSQSTWSQCPNWTMKIGSTIIFYA